MITALNLSFLKTRLFAPLYSSLVILVCLLLGKEGIILYVRLLQQQTVDRVTHSFQVKREGERLLNAVLEEKVALRGYLLNSDPIFLEKYQSEQETFNTSLEQLSQLLQEDADQLEKLHRIEAFHRQWQSQFAQKVFEGAENKPELMVQSSLDPLRSLVGNVLQREKELLNQHNHRLSRLNQMDIGLSILSTGVIFVGMGLNLWLLRRRVEMPLKQLTRVSQAWQAGQLETQLDYSSPDEIGQLADVLDTMARDINARQEWIQLRNQQLEDLISTLSHDLRTPILATRTTLKAMLGGAFGPVSDSLGDVLNEFHQANDDLLKLVEALLDISRYEAGGSRNLNPEPLNWQNIFTRVTLQVQAASGYKCEIKHNIASTLPTVCGDELEIQRVLQNLLDNAIRLSQPGKCLWLEVDTPEETYVRVSVRDQGPGIPEHERERLFYRFVQGRGRRGGAGLGLYLCRQIVEAHGGSIHVESTLGQGSTFWLLLPVGSTQAYSATLPPSQNGEISPIADSQPARP